MSSSGPSIGERRSEPIVVQDPKAEVRGVLRSKPAGFFSRRFDLSVDYEAKADAAPRRSGLGRFVDWQMCALIGIVGVPSLAYLVWQG